MMYSAYKLNKQGDNVQPDILLFLFGTSLLFHVQFELLLSDVHTDFSRGRSGGLVFPSLSEFSTVYCDPHSQRLWYTQQSRNRCFFWNSLAFSMIQQMMSIWSLVPLPFLKPSWTSGSSQVMYCWSLAWRILSITLPACEMSAIVRYFEHYLSLPFFWNRMKNWPFPVLRPLLNFPNLMTY